MREQQTEHTNFSRFSNIKNLTITAYPSPDRTRKPDTLKLGFHYSGKALDLIRASALFEDTSIRLSVAPVSRDTQNAEISWIPGQDTSYFNYTGFRDCRIAIFGENSIDTVFSDSFKVIGHRAITLEFPRQTLSIAFSDTFIIRYRANYDLISNIQIFFSPVETSQWKEISGTTTRIEDTPPIKTSETKFIPQKFESLLPQTKSTPLHFMLRDYNTPLTTATVVSDTVILER